MKPYAQVSSSEKVELRTESWGILTFKGRKTKRNQERSLMQGGSKREEENQDNAERGARGGGQRGQSHKYS